MKAVAQVAIAVTIVAPGATVVAITVNAVN